MRAIGWACWRWSAVRTGASWGCAGCTTNPPCQMTSRWPGAWRSSTGGNGYATEAATAWLDYGFGELGLTEVISMTDADNDRSLAVMRRLGMRFDREQQIEDEGMVFDAVIYVINADEWRARRES